MAETVGKVQKLTVNPSANAACVWIGSTATNAELLTVVREASEPAAQAAFENSLVDVLVSAAVSGSKVTATHDDNSSRIKYLTI